jgi:hypothetical protein
MNVDRSCKQQSIRASQTAIGGDATRWICRQKRGGEMEAASFACPATSLRVMPARLLVLANLEASAKWAGNGYS